MSLRPPAREPGYDEAEHSGEANRLVTVSLQVSVRAPSPYAARAQAYALLREMVGSSHVLHLSSIEA